MNGNTFVKARTYGSFLDLTEDQLIVLKEFWKLVLDRLNNKITEKKDDIKCNKSGMLSSWSFQRVVSGSCEDVNEAIVSKKSGEELKSSLLKIMRCDHPDIKAVKYLIARKWRVKEAYKMFINSLDYFGEDIHEQVYKEGERCLNNNHLSSNECFFYQNCKEGRLIMYIMAAKCFPSKFTIDECLKFFLNNINNSYLMLGNQAKMTVVLDMNGYTLANTDINHSRILTNILPNHFPELMTKFIIHEAPWIFNSFWSIVSTFLDQRTRSKIVFTYKDEIKNYIDEEVLLTRLGGSNDFNFEYFPPCEDEGLPKPYDDSYFKLMQERKDLYQKFEDLTYNWVDTNNDKEIKINRDEIANQLANSHVKMSEYEYCKNIYHRLKVIQGYDNINWKVLAEDKA